MSIPAGICPVTDDLCTCECHDEGVVMMHAFPCCYFPNLGREMKTTDNCMLPGPGDIRPSEPNLPPLLTRDQALERINRMDGRAIGDYFNRHLEEVGRIDETWMDWLVEQVRDDYRGEPVSEDV